MKIRQEPTAAITPHPSNPRRDHDIDGIARSISAFGFRQPLVIWDGDGHLLAGHGRLLAAQQLGLDKVPVHHVLADEMSAKQATAYRLADNRTAEGSTWDDGMLLAELDLLDDRERLEAGFDAAYLEDLRQRLEIEAFVEDPTEDEVPDVPENPVTRPGDMWLLGGTVECPKCQKRMQIEQAVKRK